MGSPCKGCDRRAEGCHSSCESYQKFRQERDKANARRNEEVELVGYIIGAFARIRGKRK